MNGNALIFYASNKSGHNYMISGPWMVRDWMCNNLAYLDRPVFNDNSNNRGGGKIFLSTIKRWNALRLISSLFKDNLDGLLSYYNDEKQFGNKT